MKRGLIAGAVAVFALVLMLDSSSQGGDKKEVTIKLVMQKAMKGGLCTKVATGKASDDEKKQLVMLFEGMAMIKCPKGDEADWKAKTKALVDAAKADDGAALKKAANCMACHKEHK
jgi:surface antigen